MTATARTAIADELVLVLGSGARNYREYLLRGLAEVSPLWLVDARPSSWQDAYVRGSSVVAPKGGNEVDADLDGLTAAATAIARHHGVRGVLTYDELLVDATARVAQLLGVRGFGIAAAGNCRDKQRTREVLTAAGVPQPRFAHVTTAAQALAAAARIGYPVVAKPRGMGMSVGVVRADDAAQLALALDIVDRARQAGPPAYADGLLIEEVVDGPEISVDAAIAGGAYQPFCLARKQLGPAPYFEEVGHVVDAGDPLRRDEQLHAVLTAAHRALGVRDGMTHTEVRLTARGPVIIEVNARLGGDLIPYLGTLATGVDPGRIAAQVATGVAPDVRPTRRRCAAIRFLYPPWDCEVRDIALPAPGSVPGLREAHAMVAPGDTVRLPPNAHLGRYAYLLAVAASPAQCATALATAEARVRLDARPLDPTSGPGDRPW